MNIYQNLVIFLQNVEVIMGDVVELIIWMWIFAGVCFAPLGYFIYKYNQKNADPFGDTELHGDSESTVLNVAENVVNAVKRLLGKK